MKIIKLDASSWTNSHDFYAAILRALGAPDWHGENVNALVESMVWGEINLVEPPFTVQVKGTKNLPPDVAEEIQWTAEDVQKAKLAFKERHGREIDMSFEISS